MYQGGVLFIHPQAVGVVEPGADLGRDLQSDRWREGASEREHPLQPDPLDQAHRDPRLPVFLAARTMDRAAATVCAIGVSQ